MFGITITLITADQWNSLQSKLSALADAQSAQTALLKAIQAQGLKIMPTLTEILASEDAEGTKIDAVLVVVKDDNAKLAALQQQLDAAIASQADPAVLQALSDKIAAHVSAIDAVLTPVAPPAP